MTDTTPMRRGARGTNRGRGETTETTPPNHFTDGDTCGCGLPPWTCTWCDDQPEDELTGINDAPEES
jgi:hypothetical protein